MPSNFYLKDRNGVWYICWSEHGRPYRVSTGTRDYPAAQKKLAQHILEHDRPRDQRAGAVLVVAVMLRYWHHHAQHQPSRDTAKRVLAHVVEFLPHTTVAEFADKAVQEKFAADIRATGVAANTVVRRIGIVQAALNRAQDRGEIGAVPKKLHRPEAVDGPGQRPATMAELQALFGAATLEHQRRFLMLAVGTCGRPISLLDLDWSRVDFDTHTLDLANPDLPVTKKRRARVPMSATLEAFLRERRSVGRVIHYTKKRKALSDHTTAWETLRSAAGVTVGAYALRKATASWLRREGISRWDVAAMLGHSLKGETDRYAVYEPGFMAATKAAIDRLYRAIGADWLASYLPAPADRNTVTSQVPVAVGDFGGRTWDRTTDPYHVKATTGEEFQSLEVANDD